MVNLRDAIIRAAQADTALDAALIYAGAGIPVFPCKQSKAPHTEHGHLDATDDQAQVRQWFSDHPDALIGMPTGEAIDGHFVIDQDDMNAEVDLPRTLTIKSMSDGRHYYYRATNGTTVRNRNRVANGIDVSGDGGYIIVPGGVDSPYTVLDDSDVAIANANVLRLAIPDTAREITADHPALDSVFGPPPGAHTSTGSPERSAQMRLIGQMTSAGHPEEDIIDAALAIPEADARAERHSARYVADDVRKMVRTTRKQFGDLAVPFDAYDDPKCHVSDREVFPEQDNGTDRIEPAWIRQGGFAFHQAHEPPGAEVREVTLADLLATKPTPIPWIIENIVASGGLTYLAGPKKGGKSTLVEAIAIDVLAGEEKALGHDSFRIFGRPPILHLDEEQGDGHLQRILHRLARPGVDGSRLFIWPRQGIDFSDRATQARIQARAASLKDDFGIAPLVIIDSMTAVSSWYGDENKAALRRRMYYELLMPLLNIGCAVLVLAHVALRVKDSAPDAQKRVRGSGDAGGQATQSLYLTEAIPQHDENGRLVRVTSRLGVESGREGGGFPEVGIQIEGAAPEGQEIGGTLTVSATDALVTASGVDIARTNALTSRIIEALTPGQPWRRPALIDHLGLAGGGGAEFAAAEAGLIDAGRILRRGMTEDEKQDYRQAKPKGPLPDMIEIIELAFDDEEDA